MLRSLMKILGSTARCVAISVVLVLLASVTSGAMVQTPKALQPLTGDVSSFAFAIDARSVVVGQSSLRGQLGRTAVIWR